MALFAFLSFCFYITYLSNTFTSCVPFKGFNTTLPVKSFISYFAYFVHINIKLIMPIEPCTCRVAQLTLWENSQISLAYKGY